MWTVSKEFRFEASHRLPYHQGKCARLHGHSWVGRVVCSASELSAAGSDRGMVTDFDAIAAAVAPLVEESLDHWHLNDSTGLDNPTSEEVARWIYDRLKPRLPLLDAVVVEETCTSRCEYRP